MKQILQMAETYQNLLNSLKFYVNYVEKWLLALANNGILNEVKALKDV